MAARNRPWVAPRSGGYTPVVDSSQNQATRPKPPRGPGAVATGER